jgi:hypothetical protein
MKAKVEISDEFIVKHNTARFSSGLEWITELMSINHNRELRVYKWYNEKPKKKLLIPHAYALSRNFIKIEKLAGTENGEVSVPEIIPQLKEFISLGVGETRNVFDFLSSPTQSVIRGLIRNARFLGPRIILTAFKHLFLMYWHRPKNGDMYLIHKDLKTNQNMMTTEKGIYFIDFGSSILTKHYFLADIVELSTNHIANTVNFDLLKALIDELGPEKFDIQYIRSQLYLLLLRRTLHFGPKDLGNVEIMTNVKEFLNNLDILVGSFEITEAPE